MSGDLTRYTLIYLFSRIAICCREISRRSSRGSRGSCCCHRDRSRGRQFWPLYCSISILNFAPQPPSRFPIGTTRLGTGSSGPGERRLWATGMGCVIPCIPAWPRQSFFEVNLALTLFGQKNWPWLYVYLDTTCAHTDVGPPTEPDSRQQVQPHLSCFKIQCERMSLLIRREKPNTHGQYANLFKCSIFITPTHLC